MARPYLIRSQHVPDRHVGLELPVREGHLERDFLSRPGRAPWIRRAARSTPNDSTPSRSTPRSTASRGANVSLGWVKRTPPGFEFAVKLYQKFTHPQLVARPDARSTRPTSMRSRPASNRSRPPIASGRCSRSFRPASRTRPKRGATSTGCSRPSATTTRRRAAAPSWSDDADDVFDLLHEHGAAWTQIDEPKFRFSIRQDLMPNIEGRSTTCGCTAGTPPSGGTTRRSEDRYNYLYSEAELRPFADAVSNGARAGQEAVRLPEQSLRRAGGRRRGGAAPPARRAGRGADARRARVALSDARGQSRYFAPFTVALMMRSGTASLLHDVHAAAMTLPEDLVLAVEVAGRADDDEQLAVGLRRIAGMRHRDGARSCASAPCRTRRRQSGVPLPPVPHCPSWSCRASAGRQTAPRSSRTTR